MSPEAKKFQPRVIASFNPPQLERVDHWFGAEAVALAMAGQFEPALAALEQANTDEKGKPIDDRGRKRLHAGLDALIISRRNAAQGSLVHGEIQAWQLSPEEDDIELRYKHGKSLMQFSERPPSLELRVNQNPPSIIEVESGKRTRDVDQLLQKAEETRKQVEEVQRLVHDNFGGSAAPYIGLMMGSEKKVITNPDGSTEEAEWTLGDLMSEWDKQGEIEEREVRVQLAEEILLTVRYQHDFFIRREEPAEYHQSEQAIECTLALLEWVAKSPDNITDRYPVGGMVAETRDAAEMLEVIRRVVLRPSYMIMEGVARSDIRPVPSYEDDFWDVLDERRARVEAQMKNPRDHDEYMSTQVKVTHDNPKQYTWDEWKEILNEEMVYLHEYLQGCAVRSVGEMRERVDFYSSLTKDGQHLLTQEVKEKWDDQVRDIAAIVDELLALEKFEQVLPWIKQKFGEVATFKTLLEKLGVFPEEKVS